MKAQSATRNGFYFQFLTPTGAARGERRRVGNYNYLLNSLGTLCEFRQLLVLTRGLRQEGERASQ